MDQVNATTFGNVRATINNNFNEINTFMTNFPKKLAEFMRGEKIEIDINTTIDAGKSFTTSIPFTIDKLLSDYGISRSHGWIHCSLDDQYHTDPDSYISYTLSTEPSSIMVESVDSTRSVLYVSCTINQQDNCLDIVISNNNTLQARTINTTLSGYVF